MNKSLIGLVNVYKEFIFPILPPIRRYYPTCSAYMIDALKKHGTILGLIMGISRIMCCNPFVKGGVDPVSDYLTLCRNPHPERHEDEIVAQAFHSNKKQENICMPRKLESIDIEVNERKGTPMPTWGVIIPGKRFIRIIEQEEERYHVISSKADHSFYSKTLESAINELPPYFTLHEK